jgi:hypothetical protein
MICIWFELLSRIPFAGLRLRLCRRHVDGCPRCRGESENTEALPPILVTAGQLPAGLDLWPGVKKRIDGMRSRPHGPAAVLQPAPRSWRWAYAAATVALMATVVLWFVFMGRRGAPLPGSSASGPHVRTRLCSAKIGDEPARVFQVQSRNPDRSIFWIAKNDKRS